MLDSTKSKRPFSFELENRSITPEPWRDGIGFGIYLAKIRQQRPMIVRLMLVGAVMVWLASVAYILVRTPAFSAFSELLISNTTLQQSGPDAVVTQLLVENSLVQSAIEMAKSSRVLERAVDRMGLENIELILPKSRSIRDLGLQIFAPEPERSETSRRQTAVATLRSNITVNRVGTSQIISVRGRALTAVDAARLTNEIAGSFVQEQNDTSAVVTTSAALRERIKVLGPTARAGHERWTRNRTFRSTCAQCRAAGDDVGRVLWIFAANDGPARFTTAKTMARWRPVWGLDASEALSLCVHVALPGSGIGLYLAGRSIAACAIGGPRTARGGPSLRRHNVVSPRRGQDDVRSPLGRSYRRRWLARSSCRYVA